MRSPRRPSRGDATPRSRSRNRWPDCVPGGTRHGEMVATTAGGARMLEAYPVVHLVKNTALSIGLMSYNGGVYYGLTADRDAMSDVDVLSSLIEASAVRRDAIAGLGSTGS